MQIVDCLSYMTKSYLGRVVDSIVKESLPRGDEERMADLIRNSIKELGDKTRIAEEIRQRTEKRSTRILFDEILIGLLNLAEAHSDEARLFDIVREHETGIVEFARSPDAFRFSDERSIDIYETVLDAALEDDNVSPEEFRLLERLRKKLGVSRREHRLLESKLGHFPRPGNELHGIDEFKDAVKQLQAAGILFYCNRADGGPIFVLPEEIMPGVKEALGFEMRPEAQEMLHEKLTTDQLHAVLKSQGIPTSGTKAERSQRILEAGVKPSEVVSTLSGEELSDLCRKLPGLKVSVQATSSTAAGSAGSVMTAVLSKIVLDGAATMTGISMIAPVPARTAPRHSIGSPGAG